MKIRNNNRFGSNNTDKIIKITKNIKISIDKLRDEW